MFQRIIELVGMIGIIVVAMFVGFTALSFFLGFLDAIFPLIAGIFAILIIVVIGAAIFPYMIVGLRLLHLFIVILYNISVYVGIYYAMYKLIMYLWQMFFPYFKLSWFNHNGLDNNIDFLIIAFPIMFLFIEFIATPIIKVLTMKLPYADGSND